MKNKLAQALQSAGLPIPAPDTAEELRTKCGVRWRLQTASFDELLDICCLRSSGTVNHASRRSRISREAGAQNWRCAYCGVRMFAGHPKEDIHLYAEEMGIPLRIGGTWEPTSFETIRKLRATIEHLLGARFGNDADTLVSACRWCNEMRRDRPPSLWARLVPAMVANRKHPHWRLIKNGGSL